MPYTKLFNSIITSTIWLEPDHVRLVWITMLALADKNGEVMASVPGLAKMAGVELEQCREALNCLLNPDPESRTKVMEGRRIITIDGGWELINHAKYRALASTAEAIDANRERQKRFRDRNAGVTPRNAKVTVRNATVTPNTLKAEAEADTKADPSPPPPPPGLGDEWIAGLEKMDGYKGIDIRLELGKAQAWCKEKGKACTNRFFINWLNTALTDAKTTITANGTNPKPAQESSRNVGTLNEGRWRDYANRSKPKPGLAGQG